MAIGLVGLLALLTAPVADAHNKITKTTSTSTVNPGGIATYTILDDSAGTSSPVTGIQITDTLPSGFTYLSTTSITLLNANSTRTAVLNPVAGSATPVWGTFQNVAGTPAGAFRIVFNAAVANTTACGAYTNTVIKTAGDAHTDVNAVNVASITVSGSAPTLVVTKVANAPLTVPQGGAASYTITVTNTAPAGSCPATGVTLTDALPAGFTYASTGAIALNGGSLRPTTTTPVLGAANPVWGSFTIPAGGSVNLTFAATVANTVAGGTYSNSASTTTTATGASITPFNGASSTLDDIVVPPIPALTKAFATSSVAIGQTTTLALTIDNTGVNAIARSGLAFTDTLRSGIAIANPPAPSSSSCGAPAFTAANATQPFTASGISVAAGSVCVVNLTVRGTAAGAVTNAAADLSALAGLTNAVTPQTLTVALVPLTVSKVFTPNSIGTGDNTQLKITLTNPNATAVTGAAFTDNYPGSMLNTAAPAGAISGAGCSGTVTAAANGSSLALSGGNVPASGSCDITVNVSSATANTYVNSTGAVTTTNAGTSTSVNGTLTVLSHVAVLKAFTPASVAVNAASVLKITLTNPNAVAITGAAFNDAYPAGLVNTGAPAGAINGAGCSGTVTAAANGASLALGGASVPAGGSCDITVNVTSAAAGSYVNNSGAVTTANAGAGISSGATLTVTAVAPPPAPQVAKVFTPNSVGTNSSTVLKITLVNVNAFALTSVAFNDTYPAALINTAAPGAAISGSAGCAGTVTAAANGSSLGFSGGNLPANGSCDITVNVTSATAGTYANSSGAVTSAEAPAGTAATGTLTVLGHLTVLKSFTPASVAVNAASVLKITLTNPNAVAITDAAFNDAYPGGLVNTGTPAGAIGGAGCSGTVTAAANGNSLVLSAGNVPAGSSCDITVNVTSAAAGSYVNNSGAVSTANAGAGTSSGATLTVTAALLAPGVSKTFTPAVVVAGDNSLLRVTITNPNAVTITGAVFTDTYPATLSNTGTAVFNAASIAVGCTGTITGASGMTSLALTNGSTPAGMSCMIDVNVTSNSAVPVLLTNPAFSVSTGNTPSGSAAAANLQVLVRPTIAKSFTPSTVLVGGASTLSLVITNPDPIALSALAFTDTFPAGLIVASTPNALNGCGGTFSAAAGASSVSLSGGSLAANQSCTLSVAVSSAGAGAYSNTSGGVSGFETGAAGAPSNTAVLTVNAPSGVQVEGFVYADPNHNLQKDGGEAGTGLTLYAKLVAASSPAGPALQAVTVDPVTGGYLFTGVAAGPYVIVINGNATLSDVTPAIPVSWTGTEAGDQVQRNVVVAAVDLRYLNFGLFNGNLVSGRVFRDNGSGGGTPNNAVQDGTEAGIGQVAVHLTNAAGAQTYDNTTTDAAGNYRLWIPAALSGGSLRVVEDNPPAYRSVGGAPAGSYDRAADAFTFTYTAGSNTANLNFADVAIETLTSPQQRTAAPGEAVFYAHTFTPGTGGSVTFSATSSAGWPQTLFRDTNCNGVLDAGEGVVTAPIATTAGTPVCVIVKVLVPTGAPVGAQNASTLQAVFSYSNASPPLSVTVTNDDLTTVGGAGGAGLALVKSQDNATPLPGGRIVYTITYTNQGSSSITSIRINDATPAFTRFASAACVAPLAAGLSACSVTASPAIGASGAIEFTLTGALLPSASGQVSFGVDVAIGP